ncbi:pyrimidine utilization regulatory protein R [Leclercia adecarboxylata]|uniref:Pyrimidine utilization regulatory protein R n=1 Tax=Leclercia adecarboxylata TaxID=83655 RepID=A0A4U9HK40_9ENTR|nr:pyrimidine utilization regulatory protein R [Leclercia adecarboxylata]
MYHFKTKENLYLLVLEYVYTQIRASEKQLSLDALPPVEALVQLVETTFDYHADHPDYIRIICMENMQRGRYMQQSALLRQVNRSALDLLETILERGKAKQLFNLTVNARDLHRLISSFSFHYVANSYTFTLSGLKTGLTSRPNVSTTERWRFRLPCVYLSIACTQPRDKDPNMSLEKVVYTARAKATGAVMAAPLRLTECWMSNWAFPKRWAARAVK